MESAAQKRLCLIVQGCAGGQSTQTASQDACPIASSWAEEFQMQGCRYRWTRLHVMDVDVTGVRLLGRRCAGDGWVMRMYGGR